MHERSESPDSVARKPRKRAAAAKRPKVTDELREQYTNPEATGLTAVEAPRFDKLPPARELTPADKLRAKIAADPTLHAQWFIPALYSQTMPRHVALNIAASWRRAKPETFGGTAGSRFEAMPDVSTTEQGAWLLKIKYVPANTHE